MKKQSDDTKSVPSDKLYSKLVGRKILVFFACLVVLTISVVVACSLGAGVYRPVDDVFRAIIQRVFLFLDIRASGFTYRVVWILTLRSTLMAIVAGAGLAGCGVMMQGVLRNPMVSPFTVGVSSGATLGASIAIILGVSLVGSGRYVIIANAFIFSMITSFLIIGFGRLRGVTPESFILVGIALMYFFSAFTSFLQLIAEEGELMAVVHWIFGSVSVAWDEVLLVLAITLVCLPFMMKYCWDLNAMAVGGDEVAISLGVNPGRVRMTSMTLVALITASITCFTGIIGFVGLVAPHIARMIIGEDHRFLLPCSCIIGAILVVAAYTVGNSIGPFIFENSALVIPVGTIMSFIGGPFFLFLLLTKRRRYWG